VNDSSAGTLTLPALRGVMGDWVYYSCLIDIRELGFRVHYAEELHPHKALSRMIQRRLDASRSRHIAEYLKTQRERLFNSLIVATYDGEPSWSPLASVRAGNPTAELPRLNSDTIESVGFLTLSGDERLFALDGQHRLAGIRRAVNEGLDGPPYDQVPVIFVAHDETGPGRERSRRLFTTLNKRATPVSKSDIIALDEDDAMAICVRRLIEETPLFGGDRIALVATNNMPAANRVALTTIGNLYDLLAILFTKSDFPLRRTKVADLQRARPIDDDLEHYFLYCRQFFEHLGFFFDELRQFFDASDTQPVVEEYRGSHGGSVLFRPAGLEIFTLVVSRMTREMDLDEAVELAARLPRTLDRDPYPRLMWDQDNKTIMGGHKVTLREILLYMVEMNGPRYPAPILLDRFRQATGRPSARLPEKVT